MKLTRSDQTQIQQAPRSGINDIRHVNRLVHRADVARKETYNAFGLNAATRALDSRTCESTISAPRIIKPTEFAQETIISLFGSSLTYFLPEFQKHVFVATVGDLPQVTYSP
jgi:hypothetical protein